MKLISSLALTFAFLTVTPVMAQQPSSTFTETRSSVAQVIFGGLGGAILGLSTLSFYGRPQDHLSNVAVGFGLGIIGGASYVAYNSVAIIPTREQTSIVLNLSF